MSNPTKDKISRQRRQIATFPFTAHLVNVFLTIALWCQCQSNICWNMLMCYTSSKRFRWVEWLGLISGSMLFSWMMGLFWYNSDADIMRLISLLTLMLMMRRFTWSFHQNRNRLKTSSDINHCDIHQFGQNKHCPKFLSYHNSISHKRENNLT